MAKLARRLLRKRMISYRVIAGESLDNVQKKCAAGFFCLAAHFNEPRSSSQAHLRKRKGSLALCLKRAHAFSNRTCFWMLNCLIHVNQAACFLAFFFLVVVCFVCGLLSFR